MLHTVISCVEFTGTALGSMGVGLFMEAMYCEGSTGTAQSRSGSIGIKGMWTPHPAGTSTSRHFAKTIILSASDVEACMTWVMINLYKARMVSPRCSSVLSQPQILIMLAATTILALLSGLQATSAQSFTVTSFSESTLAIFPTGVADGPSQVDSTLPLACAPGCLPVTPVYLSVIQDILDQCNAKHTVLVSSTQPNWMAPKSPRNSAITSSVLRATIPNY